MDDGGRESPISFDWNSCKVSMGLLPRERVDLGEIIETMSRGVEA